MELIPPAGRKRNLLWTLLIFQVLTLVSIVAFWLIWNPQSNSGSSQPFPAQDLPRTPAGPQSGPEFLPIQVVEEFRPIENPPVVRTEELTFPLHPQDHVLGVVVSDRARAYPINMLTGPSREIINDTLAGTAIAATW